jgi:outer membrane protein OmpA-like peptidoglycan-associated protein
MLRDWKGSPMRRLPLLLLPLAVAACSKSDDAQQTAAGPGAQSAPVALAPASSPQNAAGPLVVDQKAGKVTTRRGSSATEMIVDLPSDVLFAYDSAKLATGADAALSRTARIIAEGGPGPITITGYTDGKGEDDYNLKLSQRRAEAVADWLAGHGVAESRITTRGRGKANPVAPNTKLDGSDDPVGRAHNRRVEITVPRAG